MKSISIQISKKMFMTGFLVFFAGIFICSSVQAMEVGQTKMIDDGFHIEDGSPANWRNCDKICQGCEVETPGQCAEVCTAEFFCAGPWRSYAGLWGIGNAYLYLSAYGANMPMYPRQVRKGWAAWQWQVPTSGKYKVEVFYRPTDNRSPDANYYVLQLNELGVLAGGTAQKEVIINQKPYPAGPLASQGWVTLGTFEYKRGKVALVGLWAQDDTFSDEADAVRWTLMEKTNDVVTAPANSLLLTK